MRAWPSAPRSRKPRRRRRRLRPLRAPSSSIERAALAAIAAAVAPEPRNRLRRSPQATYGDVTVRPIAARSRRCSRIRRRAASRPRSRRRPRPSSRKRPSARRFARHGCRSSRTCRCPPRTKSARPAARPRRSIRRRPGCRCCSASPMSASAAATKRPSRRSRPAPPVRPCRRCRRCRNASRQRIGGRSRSRPHEPVSEYARRPAAAGTWTSTAARHLLPQRHRATIIWISPPSCGASPTDSLLQF